MADEQLGFDLGAADIILPAPPPRPTPGRRRRVEGDVDQPALIEIAPQPMQAAAPRQRRSVPEEIRRSALELAGIVDKVCELGHSHRQVFDDFLDLACSCLLADDERVRPRYV